MQRSVLCRSRRELSNEYLLAKIGFDTEENEPCKVCPLSVYSIIIITDRPGASLMFGKKIRSVWYFKDVSDELVGTISLRLRTECYSTGEAFYTDGKLYIVNRGLILRNSMFKFSGSTWGEDFIFSKALRRPLKSIILAFAELMTLSQDAFYSILEDATQEDYDKTRGKIVRLIVTRGIINEARRRLLEDPSLVARITKSECDDPTKSILWKNVMAERQAAVQLEEINVRRNELKLVRTNTGVHGGIWGGDSPPDTPQRPTKHHRSKDSCNSREAPSMNSERGFASWQGQIFHLLLDSSET